MRSFFSPKLSCVVAAALATLPACIIIDIGDEDFGVFGEDEGFFGDDFDDFDAGQFDVVLSASVRGDIGPSRGVDGDGEVDGWVSDGNINAEVEVIDANGGSVLSIVDIYGLTLEPGQRSSEVSVTGCAGSDAYDEYEYDDYTDDAEAVVVECGCDEEGVVDVVITSSFYDEGEYGSQQHTTTLRVRQ
ncbi:MAG: hypothetical protein Q8O67_14195 [Deltaproteobacteria bacterium]|nr:hypothetical protein [Deltaproteobacteria bacterium]